MRTPALSALLAAVGVWCAAPALCLAFNGEYSLSITLASCDMEPDDDTRGAHGHIAECDFSPKQGSAPESYTEGAVEHGNQGTSWHKLGYTRTFEVDVEYTEPPGEGEQPDPQPMWLNFIAVFDPRLSGTEYVPGDNPTVWGAKAEAGDPFDSAVVEYHDPEGEATSNELMWPGGHIHRVPVLGDLDPPVYYSLRAYSESYRQEFGPGQCRAESSAHALATITLTQRQE